jgi:hypothetical protein
MSRVSRFSSLALVLTVATTLVSAQGSNAKITTPKEAFGFNIGDDFQLPTYTQIEAYYKTLASESDRIKLIDIGPTEEGHRQYLMIITSPGNLKDLEHYRTISERLAHGEGLTDEQAHALANEGKAVVWIDGSIHATETPSTDQLVETAYQLASRNDPETMRILDDDIVLLAHTNPDGVEKVAEWYMRNPNPEERVMQMLPELHKKFIGQEDNRDFFMMTMKETQNLNKVLYLQWFPQILYNHHGATYPGAVIAAGSYRDPFSTRYDPIVMTELDSLTSAMNNRWEAENMPGALERDSVPYSTWYNGSIRTTGYYHNVVGILTEIMGGPNPTQVTLVPDRLLPTSGMYFPPAPQTWHYRRTIDYLVTANYAVMSYAARNRDDVLFNMYRMAKDSIDRGSEDYWTIYPQRVSAIKAAYEADLASGSGGSATGPARTGRMASFAANALRPIPSKYYDAVMKNPELRDPRGFIISADQPDFPTAVKFVNALIGGGVLVQKATAPFTVNGKSYPAGSYVVKTDQAYRPLVLDMFEPQDYPNDIKYPGGPPVPPYDAAGWTLAMVMGVHFDRVLDAFDGPFERIPWGTMQAPPPIQVSTATSAGWIVSPKQNDAFILVNQLLASGAAVFRLPAGVESNSSVFGPGTFFISYSRSAGDILTKAVADLGITCSEVKAKPAGEMVALAPARIAVWDKYGGSPQAGWMRWVMEHYGFKYSLIFPKEIDAGDLHSKYDVIIFASGAIPSLTSKIDAPRDNFLGRMPTEEEIPEQYRPWIGVLSLDKSIPQLKKFVEEGGTIITMGSSSHLAFDFGAPVSNVLTATTPDGKARQLTNEEFYIPGSLLKVKVDTTLETAWGMADDAQIYFDSNALVADISAPVLRLNPDALAQGVKPIAWFTSNPPLSSGWAMGQGYLKDGIAGALIPIGKGKLFAYSAEVTFRNWSHGTFKLLFNDLYKSSM